MAWRLETSLLALPDHVGLAILEDELITVQLSEPEAERLVDTERDALRRLVHLANAAKTYRKALEPFLYRIKDSLCSEAIDLSDRDTEVEMVVWLDREERNALREACRLMGIELAADPGDA